MKRINHSLVLLLFVSCAVKKWEPVNLDPYVVTEVNPFDKEVMIDNGYKNGLEVYKWMIASGRINSKKALSCFQEKSFFDLMRFKNKESVNYIDLVPSHIAYFRSLHVNKYKTIIYTKKEGFVGGNHVRVYKESTRDRINVYSRSCVIDDQYVVSEVYLD